VVALARWIKLVTVLEGDRRNHRPEDFLLSNPHVVLNVDEHRRRHEVALRQRAFGQPGAAGQRLGAFLAADIEIAG